MLFLLLFSYILATLQCKHEITNVKHLIIGQIKNLKIKIYNLEKRQNTININYENDILMTKLRLAELRIFEIEALEGSLFHYK